MKPVTHAALIKKTMLFVECNTDLCLAPDLR